jgi:hypothetical protein
MASRPVGLGGVGAALAADDVLRVARGAACDLDAAIMDKLHRDDAAQKVRATLLLAHTGRGVRRLTRRGVRRSR